VLRANCSLPSGFSLFSVAIPRRSTHPLSIGILGYDTSFSHTFHRQRCPFYHLPRVAYGASGHGIGLLYSFSFTPYHFPSIWCRRSPSSFGSSHASPLMPCSSKRQVLPGVSIIVSCLHLLIRHDLNPFFVMDRRVDRVRSFTFSHGYLFWVLGAIVDGQGDMNDEGTVVTTDIQSPEDK
jgi:hypothetical protein